MKFLDEKGISFSFKDLRVDTISKALLRHMLAGLDSYRKAFNTSGASYKDGNWKTKVAGMNKEQVIDALTADPMLIKRPLVRGVKGVTVGYDEDAIENVAR